ncbi:expressed unknown protein [Seminavis robusta]|uniref:Uncharacterized protein n=1 Tax=Seminavis robusta TaxID=568900 RepID=A0A9N8DGK5_9STRA|nr:expressed unknown protein [Seminavis robusta]|eukprot:Sro57_g033330.1 n/a (143) ;mRNA; r:72906-73406
MLMTSSSCCSGSCCWVLFVVCRRSKRPMASTMALGDCNVGFVRKMERRRPSKAGKEGSRRGDVPRWNPTDALKRWIQGAPRARGRWFWPMGDPVVLRGSWGSWVSLGSEVQGQEATPKTDHSSLEIRQSGRESRHPMRTRLR